MSYPLVLLGGIALGSGILSIQVPQQQANAASTHNPAKRFAAVRGRQSAESPELRELRAAEASLFPDVGSRDLELSAPEFWDETLKRGAAPGETRKPDYDGTSDELFGALRMPSFPIKRHARIAKYIEYFTSTSKGRKLMTTWLRRSGRYEEVVSAAMRTHELPRELSAVAFIESGFWPTARSSAGAVGLWQFMPQTARAYGLFVDKSIDERRSIWRSTEAAAQHLKDLHDRFRSWDLALAAYNMGYKQLTNRMQEMGVDDFWSLSDIDGALPRETALYVPKVLAVAVILNNLERFQLDDVERMPALRAAEIRVPPGVRMSMIARAAGTSLTTLSEMNPEFRLETIPDRGGPVSIRIPSQGLSRAKTMLPRLLQEDDGKLDTQVSPEFDWGDQELDKDGNMSRLEKTAPLKKRGDAGADFPEPEPAIETKEELDPSKGSPPPLLVPSAKPPAPILGLHRETKPLLELMPSTSSEPVFEAGVRKQLGADLTGTSPLTPVPASKLRHRVQPGENVWKLSAIYGVPRWRIIYDNGLRHPNVLPIGRLLVLNTPEFKDAKAPVEEASEDQARAGNE